MPTREEALAAMQQQLNDIVERNRIAFNGSHAADLEKLMGLSKEDLAAITPGTSSAAIYGQLIDVVKVASAQNMSIAELKDRIVALGAVAVSIAKKAGVLLGVL